MSIITILQLFSAIVFLALMTIYAVHLHKHTTNFLDKFLQEIHKRDEVIQKLKREKQRLISKIKALQDDGENDEFILNRQLDMQFSESDFEEDFWDILQRICVDIDHLETILEEKRNKIGNYSLSDDVEYILIKIINKLKKML